MYHYNLNGRNIRNLRIEDLSDSTTKSIILNTLQNIEEKNDSKSNNNNINKNYFIRKELLKFKNKKYLSEKEIEEINSCIYLDQLNLSKRDLILANDKINNLKKENTELKNKIEEKEKIIINIEKTIIKSNEKILKLQAEINTINFQNDSSNIKDKSISLNNNNNKNFVIFYNDDFSIKNNKNSSCFDNIEKNGNCEMNSIKNSDIYKENTNINLTLNEGKNMLNNLSEIKKYLFYIESSYNQKLSQKDSIIQNLINNINALKKKNFYNNDNNNIINIYENFYEYNNNSEKKKMLSQEIMNENCKNNEIDLNYFNNDIGNDNNKGIIIFMKSKEKAYLKEIFDLKKELTNKENEIENVKCQYQYTILYLNKQLEKVKKEKKYLPQL